MCRSKLVRHVEQMVFSMVIVSLSIVGGTPVRADGPYGAAGQVETVRSFFDTVPAWSASAAWDITKDDDHEVDPDPFLKDDDHEVDPDPFNKETDVEWFLIWITPELHMGSGQPIRTMGFVLGTDAPPVLVDLGELWPAPEK